ncbi:MAG TPA: phosphoribosylglycinamide formyltransferase [Bacteroidota bacterium]|nr:phosphoribosylglycinamide formyltransferase [Bacteroidota bacterium]
MNVAVFASGRGSNFQAILQAIRQGQIPAQVCVVVGDNPTAGAFELARNNAIPTIHLNPRQFPSAQAYSSRLIEALSHHNADVIALAGYLKRIPDEVVRRFRNKILNVHPALLPAFGGKGMYGIHVHETVIAAGVKVSGATVHLVNEEYDRGPILLQKAVEVQPDDTPETLAARVLKVEHEIYPLALKAFAEGRVRIDGNRAWILHHA